MQKDTFYFSHDANAQDDPKCIILIEQLGMEGYGIFWGLIELLRNEKNFTLPMAIIPAIARRWNTSKEKVTTVISNFNLFEIQEDKFFSLRLIRSMKVYNDRKQILSEAGKRGNVVKWQNFNKFKQLSPPDRLADRHPIALKERKGKKNKEKKRKENEIKEKEREYVFAPPSFDLVKNYCLERQNNINPQRFIDYYESNGWKIGKVMMKDWKATIRSWETNKIETVKETTQNWIDKYKPKK